MVCPAALTTSPAPTCPRSKVAPPAVRLVPSRLAEKALPSPSSPPPLKVVPSATIPVRLKAEERLTWVVATGMSVAASTSTLASLGRVMLSHRLGRVEREGVLVDVEPPGLLRPAVLVAIGGRQRRRLPGVPLRDGPVADRLGERRRRPVGVGHGEGLVRLAAVDAGRQQLQSGVVARGQGDGLPGGADDVVGPGGAEVEGGAAGGQAGPEQAGGEGITAAVEPAPTEGRPVGHDPRPVEGRGEVDLASWPRG